MAVKSNKSAKVVKTPKPASPSKTVQVAAFAKSASAPKVTTAKIAASKVTATKITSPKNTAQKVTAPKMTAPKVSPSKSKSSGMLDRDDHVALLRHMLRIRCLDDRMLKLQRAGRIGFVGTAKGIEAAIIGSAYALRPQDWLWSGLREGGAAVMRGLPLSEYLAQMYCNSNDTAKGRQMCNHFQHKGSHYPSWSSVIGTQIPHGVGAAFAAKQKNLDEVHAIYFGDGATSSNGFHSGMNMAAVWKVPAVFVCIDNGWAISVCSAKQTAAKSFADKAIAYGMPGEEVDGNDVLACHAAVKKAHDRALAGKGASLVVLKTYRIMGHSSSDDPTKYRDEKEVAAWAARDPIDLFEKRLLKDKTIDKGTRAKIEAELFAEIDHEIHVQEDAPKMALKTLVEDVYADVPKHLRKQFNRFLTVAERLGYATPGDGAFPL